MPIVGTPHAPAESLWNRTYLGLLFAQFLAAFNDQAIHASAMFFAINTQTLSEDQAISLMPILFYAPWALFCTLAGYLADRYSKRTALVSWKFAEVAITSIALFGFWIGTHEYPHVGSWIVLGTVFLMGTHSAFFVPAKYGVMPEILTPGLLSRGNGLLESLSFLAVILGTVSGGVLSYLFLRQEWMIGLILLSLALLGAVASLLIRKMPAADPTLPFPRLLYAPLVKNFRALFASRPLIFAVIGIAFFTFIVAFMRATVYMLGESRNPRWDELSTSAVVGSVALGIGLGSPLAGWLSGHKVELGLIPLGALGMVVGCAMASAFLGYVPLLVAFIVLIGFSTGFYLVPLFTLLQYRAPKTSKGDMIATSNFINVTGAIAASMLFAGVVKIAKETELIERVPITDHIAEGRISHIELERGRPVEVIIERVGESAFVIGHPAQATGSESFWETMLSERKVGEVVHVERGIESENQVIVSNAKIGDVTHWQVRLAGSPLKPAYDSRRLPKYLFLGAAIMTLGTLGLLWWRLPDLLCRSRSLVGSWLGEPLHLEHVDRIPGSGRVVLRLPDGTTSRDTILIAAAADRTVRYLTGRKATLERAERVFAKGGIVAMEASTAIVTQLEAHVLNVTIVDRTAFFGIPDVQPPA